MTVKEYTPDLLCEWNAFVAGARNATFLFHRNFMDYHADRFRDASLLFYKGERLLGVLPASCHDNEIVSHGGLTYGGFLLADGAHAVDVGEMLDLAMTHYRSHGYRRLTVKPVPAIYHAQPSDDELYWLFRRGARLEARGLSTAINLAAPLPFSTLRRRKVNLAQRKCVSVCSTQEKADYETYWKILTQVLQAKHNKVPVHSLDEILLLRERFPENIVLYIARHPVTTELLAGTLLFLTPQVVHAQYIASSERGRELGALDAVFHHLLQTFAQPLCGAEISQRYFDFGISTEDGGTVLNEGLIFQKEGFGGRSIVYDVYSLDL